MATKTTNYNLIKPAYDEDADIKVINDNMDIIDTKMKEIENAGGSAQITVDAELSETSTNPVQNKVISSKINELNSNLQDKASIASIITDINEATVNITVINGWDSNVKNLPSDAYKAWYILLTTWVYSTNTGDLTATRNQILISQYGDVWARFYENNVWTSWVSKTLNTVHKGDLITRWIASASFEFPSMTWNNNACETDITLEGYTPIGIVGCYCDDSVISAISPHINYNTNMAYCSFVNLSSYSVTALMHYNILYVKN